MSWTQSYTLYDFRRWYVDQLADDWNDLIRESKALLQKADELQDIVQLVGPEALSETEHLLLMIAQMIQEDFLQQSPFEENDRFSPLDKSYWMLKTLINYYHHCHTALENDTPLDNLRDLPGVDRIARMKEIPPENAPAAIQDLLEHIHGMFNQRAQR